MVLFVVLSGWLAYNMQRHHQEASAAATIEARCEEVYVHWRSPWWLAWADEWTGETIFSRVSALNISDSSITDAELLALPISQFGRLKFVEFDCPEISQETTLAVSCFANVGEVQIVVLPEELCEEDLPGAREWQGRQS